MSAHDRSPGAQVFRDATGRRWRRVRWVARIAGIVSSILALALVAAILAPPLLPAIAGGGSQRGGLVHLPRIATTKRERARIAARRRLFVERGGRRGPAALRPGALPLGRGGARARSDSSQIVAAFYVNWDDNSWSSFRTHVADMDWVVCEWAFLAPGGDSVRLRIDPRVLYLAARQPTAARRSPHWKRVIATRPASHRSRFATMRCSAIISKLRHGMPTA